MSNLHELLNPENPARAVLQSNADGQVMPAPTIPAAPQASSPNVDDQNPVFIHESVYPRITMKSLLKDSSDNGNSQPSLAEDTGHPYHENCPDSLDCLPDTNDKPQHTLPVILRCAILGSAKRKLTIRDIYAAMENKYPYYRTAGPAWKQSVRHHLSLSRLFERKAKPVTEPGFGSYWTVNLDAPPGTKRPRKRGRHNKNVSANKNDSPAKTEVAGSTGRRGRPKKNAPQDFEFEPTLGLPSTNTIPVPANDYHTLHTPNGSFATYQFPSGSAGCSSQQYRLHSVYDLASPNFQQHDDDEEMPDVRGHHSPTLSEDAEDSIDGHSEEHAIYPCSGDPRTLPPPSLSSVPVDPDLLSNFDGSSQYIGRLQEEIKELQKRMNQLSTANARLTNELRVVHEEMARLRERNSELERGIREV